MKSRKPCTDEPQKDLKTCWDQSIQTHLSASINFSPLLASEFIAKSAVYLSPYSLDLNSIEEFYAELKEFVR